MRAGGGSGTDPGRIAGACVATATGGGPPMWVDTRAVSEPRRLDLSSSSAVPLADGACVALSDGGGRLSAGSRPARSDGEKCPVATVAVESLTTAAGVPVGSPSVTPEPARRLDAVQFGEIKRAYLRQLLCGRGLGETGGQVVEPSLVLILEVEQSTHRILPALRSRAAIPRWSIMAPRLRCLVALSITPLSLGVGQSHGNCAPLRNAPTSRSLPVRGLGASRCKREAAAPGCSERRGVPQAAVGGGGGLPAWEARESDGEPAMPIWPRVRAFGAHFGPAPGEYCARTACKAPPPGKVVPEHPRATARSGLIAGPPTAAAVPVSDARSCPCGSSCPR